MIQYYTTLSILQFWYKVKRRCERIFLFSVAEGWLILVSQR
ncbi:hypothetical protein HMPREF1576_00960, partial [Gardnerella pickettii JCP7719]